MHSLIIISIIVATLALQGFGVEYSLSGLAAVLGVAVCFVGMPHGSLDHLVGKQLFQGKLSSLAMPIFFASYLAVVLLVVAGWWAAPVVTIAGFFALSAWHFGLEEDERNVVRYWQWPCLIARGGMVIWIPAVFHGATMEELLSIILPVEAPSVGVGVVAALQAISPVLAILTLIDVTTYRTDSNEMTSVQPGRLPHVIRTILFAALFATTHPLVSFGIYFCGWHSIRGLIHLRQQFNVPTGQFLLSLIPITLAALVLCVLGFNLLSTQVAVTPAMIQTTFVGLSAVAIPHLLLHVVADFYATQSSPIGTEVAR